MKKTDGSLLKKYIYDNEMVEIVLDSIGCQNIKYHTTKKYWTCSNPDGDNPNAVMIKNNSYLGVVNYTRKYSDKADIITLVQKSMKTTFPKACEYIRKLLGMDNDSFFVNGSTYNSFSEYKQRAREMEQTEELQRELSENVLCAYVPLLYIGWFREGIMPWTRQKFGLCYSYKHKRVIIPIRHWKTGKLLGTSKRTTIEEYKEFGITKYVVTPNYKKSLNVYGLYENKADILKNRYVVIYEAEKSVLKRDSLTDYTGIAIQGKNLSDEQVRIIKSLDIDEVIFALDKDVSEYEVLFMCEKLSDMFKVSYIYDTWDILGDKDSPADARNKDFQFLFNNRIIYDDNKKKEYQKLFNRSKQS